MIISYQYFGCYTKSLFCQEVGLLRKLPVIQSILVLSFVLLLPRCILAQATPLPYTPLQFFDNNGVPLAGGQVFTCVAGGTCPGTPQATFTDFTGATPNSNPVILDAAGRAPIYLGAQAYKIVLEDSLGNVIWTQDGIQPNSLSGVSFTQAGAGAISESAQTKLREQFSVTDYGADKTGVNDSTGAFNLAVSYASSTRGGAQVNVPCGLYTIVGTVNVSVPTISVWGENQSCVVITYTGSTRPFIWQINPFSITPGGIFGNMTILGTNLASEGILGGQCVACTYTNLLISGFTSTTANGGLGGAGIHMHNKGNLATWTEQNVTNKVSLGGHPATNTYNTVDMLLDSDNPGDSFGHNNFDGLQLNVSTGQKGFYLASGFFYDSILNASCNADNALSGTVAALCFDSADNWDSNTIQILGEFQTVGPGTGTQFAGQVESTGKFANLKGSNVNIFGAGDVILPLNNLAPPATSPDVTLVQGAHTSDDTGTFTLGGVATSPQPIQRANFGSLGLLIGADVESPYVSIFEGTQGKFQWLTVPFGSPIGSGIDIGGVDQAGGVFSSSYHTQCNSLLANCNAPGLIDGNVPFNLGATNNTAHRSGFSNSYFLTTPGINESLSGDVNFSGGWGFVEGSNIAHPIAWGYTLDTVDFEVYEKNFQSPILTSNLVFQILHGGSLAPQGHLDQLVGDHNIGGTCSVSASTSCAFAATAVFNSKPVCVASFEFDLTGGATYHITPTVNGCTVTFSSAQTGTIDFIVVGNPN